MGQLIEVRWGNFRVWTKTRIKNEYKDAELLAPCLGHSSDDVTKAFVDFMIDDEGIPRDFVEDAIK